MLLDPQNLGRSAIGTALGALLRRPALETKSATPQSEPKVTNRGHPMRARRTTADRVREALLNLSASRATCVKHEEKAWSSITFAGTRHEVTLRFEGAEAVAIGEELIECLPEHEFTIPGQLVADATITEVDHRFGMHERMIVTAVLLLLEES
ncbi:hypothetical protein EH31_04405 [Erythrobacter longus]|uniref:Uncharacterized protein n=1 Tax=Erythrobacter longus TaxID=1044 RepID=A0A074MEM5_ERYLO|nr:hypothetical protein [Erythrobacter longus]KEO91919.1 hypothetical protein EH31_04405 [Erythrobacter longus]